MGVSWSMTGRRRHNQPPQHHMSKKYFTQTYPSGLTIELPECEACSAPMSLTRVTPGLPGFDLRTFECRKCDRSVTKTVELPPRD